MGESAIAMCECANVVYTVSFDLRMYLCVTGKLLLQDETRMFVVIPVNSHDAICVLHWLFNVFGVFSGILCNSPLLYLSVCHRLCYLLLQLRWTAYIKIQVTLSNGQMAQGGKKMLKQQLQARLSVLKARMAPCLKFSSNWIKFSLSPSNNKVQASNLCLKLTQFPLHQSRIYLKTTKSGQLWLLSQVNQKQVLSHLNSMMLPRSSTLTPGACQKRRQNRSQRREMGNILKALEM